MVTRGPSESACCGIGESSDGYHVSAPDPEGRGAETAIRGALAQAAVAPRDVGYVNLHGTATPKNDAMESRVVSRLFGDGAVQLHEIADRPHARRRRRTRARPLLAAAQRAQSNRAGCPAHDWDGVRDPTLPELNLVRDDERFGRDVFVSNSFAFGGSNTAIAIGRA